jgi:hypothetical protein
MEHLHQVLRRKRVYGQNLKERLDVLTRLDIVRKTWKIVVDEKQGKVRYLKVFFSKSWPKFGKGIHCNKLCGCEPHALTERE